MIFRRTLGATRRALGSRSAQAGLVVGIAGLCLTSWRPLYLDPPARASHDGKPTARSFDTEQPAVVDRKLRQHEKSISLQKGAGISRYDVVQVARCVDSDHWYRR